jgi:hypothetical protein
MENYLDPVFRTTNESFTTAAIRFPRAGRHGASGSRRGSSLWAGRGLLHLRAAAGYLRGSSPSAVLVNKFYVDEVYDFLIIRPVALARVLHRVVDAVLIDNGVRAAWVMANGAMLRCADWRRPDVRRSHGAGGG